MNADDFNDRWVNLLSEQRRKKDGAAAAADAGETRTEIERDYDRILFSTPVRRLADKTQVFPLDKNDSVRTRLTHSHEVSNLSRSLGTTLAFECKVGAAASNYCRNIPSLLAAIGLAHDLGNPPFGHQGESAIQSWFKENKAEVLSSRGLSEQQQQDFLKFEGNAQAFRLVTKLQLLNDDFGLDLTYATLAGMMKYPTSSDRTNKEFAATKKHGFFASEQHIAERVFSRTGTGYGIRHPLAYVMESCDDIAYVVLDVEDAVKKGLASFSDLIEHLRHEAGQDVVVNAVITKSCAKHDEYRKLGELSPLELNDVSMQRFRVFAIGELVRCAVDAFKKNEKELVTGNLKSPLLEVSDGEALRKALKTFGFRQAYTHRSVLKVELLGYNVLRRLMDIFWDAIVNRADENKLDSQRKHPFSRFVYGRISENYRRAFERPNEEARKLPVRYRECLLLTDMISGMTDSYAVDLQNELDSLIGAHVLVKRTEVPK